MVEVIMNKGTPDAERQSCYDCWFCKSALSWWCRNTDAIEYRGTSIPGVIKCKFWEPVRTIDDLSFLKKTFGDFIYIQNEISPDVPQQPTKKD